MMQFSLFDRRPEEWLPLLEEHQISVVARGPVAKGLLTEKPLDQASDSMKQNGYLSYSFEELTNARKAMEEVAPDLSMTEKSAQYLLAQPAVASVITGASKIEQLRENIPGGKCTAFNRGGNQSAPISYETRHLQSSSLIAEKPAPVQVLVYLY